MKAKLIKTEAENEAALARLNEIFDAEPGTPKGDEAELLTALIEMYEQQAYPIDLPDPIVAIKFRMDQAGLKPKDLIPHIGSASKVSEVLSGQRDLSKTMIRNLIGLGIPAEVLLQERGAKTVEKRPGLRAFPKPVRTARKYEGGYSGAKRAVKSRDPGKRPAKAA